MRVSWIAAAAAALFINGSGVGLAAPTTRSAGQGAGDQPISSRFDEATGLWFTRHVDGSGRVKSEVTGRELTVTKQFADGRLDLEIKTGKQALSIAVSKYLIDIRSGKKRVRFDPTKATEDDYSQAKELLAHSRVVSRLRSAAAGIGSTVLAAPEGFEFLLTDSIVAILDGDPTATRRLKDRFRERLLGLGMQPAAAGAIGNCYDEYRREVYNAMMDTDACINDFEVWNVPMRNLCYFEWTIRVEGAWFEFVGCTLSRAVQLG
ncbi:MAG: hypothetical protein AB7I50_16270 [Vicinamibacterales bacterium]